MKTKVYYQCQHCGAESAQYLGRCSECLSWNTMESKSEPEKKSARFSQQSLQEQPVIPQLLRDISIEDNLFRYSSGFPELDRVLGGGMIPGAYILLGGDPGIGKSTLMLQVAQKLGHTQRTILYVSGEESVNQIKIRSDRLGLSGENILVYTETDIAKIIEEIKTSRPDVAIIDSIQSVYDPTISGTPGNISQVKECAAQLMGIAKALQVTVVLIGHVTKDGMVSGPKLLEHTVDAVFYLEGEKFHNLRILRSMKNRFGSTQEIGIFEMGENGLLEVDNPSELFLSESSYQNLPGSAIVATLQGNRPILVEIQALSGFSSYASPRRVATGIDAGRLNQIIAVLERRIGLDFSKHDVYVNVVGGIRIQEPAADLGIAIALVSANRNIPLKPNTVLTGEIGLTGEVRPVSQHEVRLTEAEKLGFERIVLPYVRKEPVNLYLNGINRINIRHLTEALTHALDQKACLPQDRIHQSNHGD